MPRFDKTGPEGKGSKTGRGLGTCNDKTQEKNKSDDFKRSRRGIRRWFRIGRRN